jgi:hypothetical protein
MAAVKAMAGQPEFMVKARERAAQRQAVRPAGFRRSTTGNGNAVVDQGNWRKQLQTSRIKFDDVAKETYLLALFETGQKGMAADAAGVDRTTVINHLKNDPDFEEAYQTTLELRGQAMVEQVEREAMAGFQEDIVNKDGEVVGYRTKYETQIRLAILKRYDSAYRDQSTVNVNMEGKVGVLVAPAAMTVEQFTAAMADQRAKQRELDAQAQQYLKDGQVPTGPVIEGEAVDVTDG